MDHTATRVAPVVTPSNFSLFAGLVKWFEQLLQPEDSGPELDSRFVSRREIGEASASWVESSET